MPAEPGAADTRVGVLLLSAFGLGLSPIMPGTVASLATAGAMACVAGQPLAFTLLGLLLALTGSWVTLRYADRVTGPEGRGDPGWVVSDEVAGQGLACLGALAAGGSWPALAASFVLFRVFDMLKPPPVRTLERLHGARGILLDDIAAGAIAAVLTVGLGLAGLLRG